MVISAKDGYIFSSSLCKRLPEGIWWEKHGSLNVPIEHHPTIRYMVYNGYYKVMSNIPKMGHLPTPDISWTKLTGYFYGIIDGKYGIIVQL